jgi:hypothetical protein
MLTDALTPHEGVSRSVVTWWRLLYIAACAGLTLLLAYARSTPYAHGTDLDYLLAFSVMVALFPWQQQAALLPVAVTGTDPETGPGSGDPQPASANQRKPRYYYLDNLKSVLTLIVVLHHISLGFSGGARDVTAFIIGDQALWWTRVVRGFPATNQGYFMSLFFFVSGYFTPRSHARKGTREFVRDKLKRYGVPYLVWFFGLNAALWCFILDVSHVPFSYIPGAGPPWFLKALIVYNLWTSSARHRHCGSSCQPRGSSCLPASPLASSPASSRIGT